jgi:tryptophan-rich sensory protein
MEMQEWYLELAKPTWAPPTWLFGPVWAVLYVVIFISFTYIFAAVWRGQLARSIALPFVLNLIFNLLFTPIQFGLQSNLLAAIDILLVLGTLIWAMIAVYPYRKWVALVNIPYLAWVSFATILQLTITYLNW